MFKSPIPIYIINLKSRTDRRDLVIIELQKIFTDNLDDIEFIDALYTPKNGAIGCAISHAYALSRFLYKTDAPSCLIIEDDFFCDDAVYFEECFNSILQNQFEWDVTLFAHNVAIPKAATNIKNLSAVLNSQTASAYMVHRDYAPDLIRLFYKSSQLLNSDFENLQNNFSKHFFAIDMLWKNEQIFKKFLAFFPAPSSQRPGYSDIENTDVDYKV